MPHFEMVCALCGFFHHNIFLGVLKVEAFPGKWRAVGVKVFVLCLRIFLIVKTRQGAVSHWSPNTMFFFPICIIPHLL